MLECSEPPANQSDSPHAATDAMPSDPSGASAPLSAGVRLCLQAIDQESHADHQNRAFASLCGLVDAYGAEQVFASLQSIVESADPQMILMASNVLRKACMRAGGTVFGQRYDAHIRILPVVVRGSNPVAFPAELDRITSIRLHDVLRQVLLQRCRGSHAIYPLPVGFLYTMHEFETEKITRLHEILQLVLKEVGEQTMATAPKFISNSPLVEGVDRYDNELFDIRQPKIGVLGWRERQLKEEARQRPLETLHAGAWITTRLVPVVLLVPHGQEPPVLDGFGENAMKIGQMLAFASVSRPCADSEGTDVSIIPAGLYCVEDGSSIGRLMVAQNRITHDLLKSAAVMKKDRVSVGLNYDPSGQSLHVIISDGESNESSQISLPAGITSQLFIETLSLDLASLGMKVRVDLGDSMIRLGAMDSVRVH